MDKTSNEKHFLQNNPYLKNNQKNDIVWIELGNKQKENKNYTK